MPTLTDLGTMVQGKYPAYANMDPTTVGQLVQAKYPGAYSQFQGTQPTGKGGFVNDVKDLGLGILKGIGEVGDNIVGAAGKVQHFIAPNSQGPAQFSPETFVPTNTAQKVGSFIGKSAPYFLAPELAPEAEGFSTLARAGANALGGAANAGVISAVQGQNPVVPTLAGGAISGAGSLVSSGVKALGKEAEGAAENIRNPKLDFGRVVDKRFTPEEVGQAKADAFDFGPDGGKAAKKSFFTDLTHELDNTRDTELTTGAFKDVTAPTAQVKSALEEAKQGFFNDASYPQISKIIDAQIKSLDRFGDNVPLSAINDLKVSMGKTAFPELGSQPSNFVRASMTDAYKKSVEDVLDHVGTTGKVSEVPLPKHLQSYFEGKQSVPIQDYNKFFRRMVNVNKMVNKSIETVHPLAQAVKSTGSRMTADAIAFAAGHLFGGTAGGVVTTAVVDRLKTYLETPAGQEIFAKLLEQAGKTLNASGKVVPIAEKTSISAVSQNSAPK